jgi:DNA repair exonuclease SbcCD ATPase subunit
MAAGLEVLAADQPIQLNGEPLVNGERRRIEAATELTVGSGVRLQISPGGGQALPRALEQQQQCCQQLEQLQQQLQLNSSDQAETIERQRTALERELNNLRQAAKAIPWSGLQQRLEQIEPRRQQLAMALGDCEVAPLDPGELRSEQESLRQRSGELSHGLERSNQQLRELEQNRLSRQAAQERLRGRCGQLEGSLQVLGERLQHLNSTEAAAGELDTHQQQLGALRTELEHLQRARLHGGSANPAADAAEQLEALEREKDRLLSQLGQAQQRSQSLGAANPMAELEQRQVAWEEAEAERAALEQRAMALRLLLERFHSAQSTLANRYSEPLRAAITPYLTELDLAELASQPHQPLLAFDPQQGFHDLQLRQGEEAFAFERLSGGMREQLGATVRLAMAEVLKPAYADALPLVFDDAFTNSDRERLVGLRRMLERGIQQGIQIVLLTCHADDYAALLPNNASSEPAQQHAQKNPPEVIGGTAQMREWGEDRVIVKLE